jgi:hypothetical protein
MIQTILNNNMRQPNVRTIHQPRTQRNTHVRFPANTNTNTSNRRTNETLSSLLLDGFLTSDNLSYIFDYTIEPTTTGVFQNFLDPVQIYPTETEIANATSVVRYGDIEDPLNQSCPISLDPFHVDDQVTAIKYCGHIFKTDEIQSWFESNVRCPVCRYDIRNYQSSSRYETNNISESTVRRETQTNTNTEIQSETEAETEAETQTNVDPNIQPSIRSSVSIMSSTLPYQNINVVRNSIDNQIDEISFDIPASDLTNTLINGLTSNIIRSLDNTQTSNTSNNTQRQQQNTTNNSQTNTRNSLHNIFTSPSLRNMVLQTLLDSSYNRI